MQKWEYEVFKFDILGFATQKDIANLKEILNGLGSVGYEVVGAFIPTWSEEEVSNKSRSSSSESVFVLKRPKE